MGARIAPHQVQFAFKPPPDTLRHVMISNNNRPLRAFKPAPILLLAIGTGLLLTLASCGKDARLADHKVRVKPVAAVTAHGKTLDEKASPKDVVYVLLKSVLADYEAADDEQREKEVDIQLGLAATERLKERYPWENPTADDLTGYVYKTVRRWTPTLAFYRDTYREDYESLASRMLVRSKDDSPDAAEIYLNVDHPDPENNPNAGALAHIYLFKENGMWRVWWVGWETGARSWQQAPKRTTRVQRKPATKPAAERSNETKAAETNNASQTAPAGTDSATETAEAESATNKPE